MKIHGGSFANMQQINKTVSALEHGQRASNDKTIRHLEGVDAKTTRSTNEVIDSAVKTKHVATNAKGNFIDTLA